MPTAVKVLNELVASPDVDDAQKHHLLATWDRVLGLDLQRDVGLDRTLAPETLDLVRQRDAAREAGDYERADRLRDELVAAGFEVMDTADGTRVRPSRRVGGSGLICEI